MATGRQSKAQIISDYGAYVNPGRVDVFRQIGLEFVPGRREGVWLWDVDGSRRLLNCRSSGGVFNLGHRPPQIIAAVRNAMDDLDVGDHMLLSEVRAELGSGWPRLPPATSSSAPFLPAAPRRSM